MNKQKILAFFIVLFTLIIADTLWFIVSLERLYSPLMGPLLSPAPNLVAGLGFYLIYAIGLNYFVIFPNLKLSAPNYKKLGGDAAFFGLVAFSTYDLTALSVINNFSAKIAFIDLAWGVSAATFTCIVATFILRKFSK